MNKKAILERIIKEEGNCDWVADPTFSHVCKTCPLGKLRKHPDDNFMSCVEALGVQEEDDPEEIDAIYKDAAARQLLDIEVEEMLTSETNGDKNTGK